LDRQGPVVRLRRDDGQWDTIAQNLAPYDSAIARLADPRNAPEVLALRDSVRAWRFYDHFRADTDAPSRMPQIGTFTPVLGNDGRDLAAAIQTIREIGDEEALRASVDDAFPGSRVWIENAGGRFGVQMEQHGLLRPFDAAELSDGTLRYLLWIAALLSPRPPELMVLNEPETSLHPDLLPPLGRLIARTAERSQVIVVSHAPSLIEELSKQPGCRTIRLEKAFGETVVADQRGCGGVAWHWPGR
jgi:predicted ATPase